MQEVLNVAAAAATPLPALNAQPPVARETVTFSDLPDFLDKICYKFPIITTFVKTSTTTQLQTHILEKCHTLKGFARPFPRFGSNGVLVRKTCDWGRGVTFHTKHMGAETFLSGPSKAGKAKRKSTYNYFNYCFGTKKCKLERVEKL